MVGPEGYPKKGRQTETNLHFDIRFVSDENLGQHVLWGMLGGFRENKSHLRISVVVPFPEFPPTRFQKSLPLVSRTPSHSFSYFTRIPSMPVWYHLYSSFEGSLTPAFQPSKRPPDQKKWLTEMFPSYARHRANGTLKQFFAPFYADFFSRWPPTPTEEDIRAADGNIAAANAKFKQVEQHVRDFRPSE